MQASSNFKSEDECSSESNNKYNNEFNINQLDELPPLSIPKIRRCQMIEKIDRLSIDKQKNNGLLVEKQNNLI